MAVYTVNVFCHECVEVHSIEIDIDSDEGLPHETVAMIIEDLARCPRTGRRLTLQGNNQRASPAQCTPTTRVGAARHGIW
jgi:hypothetical protein